MKISFDFDSTITRPEWSRENETWDSTLHLNYPVVAEMRALHRRGHEIHIVTTRCHSNGGDVEDIVDLHDLPVESVTYTDGALKGETLAEMGVDVHFDDGLYERDDCQLHGVRCVVVAHPYDIERYRGRLRSAETFDPPTDLNTENS
jgi:hypothetical protein